MHVTPAWCGRCTGLHGFGYAFTDAVEEVRDTEPVKGVGLRCWLRWEGRELLIQKVRAVIGRDPGADVQLESPRISRQHAQVVIEGPRALIEDLGSKNGTLVTSERHAMMFIRARGKNVKGWCRGLHECELPVQGSGNRGSAPQLP
jgi:hypothetical protein